MESTAHFDELIHAPYRLRICSLLAAANAVEFGTLREGLGVSDSVLSKHLSSLSSAGYVRSSSAASVTHRRRLWVSFTPAGRLAFQEHVKALREILATTDESTPTDGS
jgi:DNA-binding MarR family transcriptional regulator